MAALVCAAVVLSILGIHSLPVGLGEALAILGLWAAFGAALGRGRGQAKSLDHHLQRRAGTVISLLLLFAVVAVLYALYVTKDGSQIDGLHLVGLLALTGTGLVAGFIAGADGDPGEGQTPTTAGD